MTPAAERYARAQELFEAAVDLPRPERDALLHERCDGEAELRSEVEALLEADAWTDSLDGQPFAIPQDVFDDAAEEQFAGRHFGPYELVREIGRGGLGSVYLAMRSDGEYRKEVALKLIRRGFDTDDILRRFRTERQILAQLDHPNIARLIDGGTTDEGLPYFVMEYVKGEPISAYCDLHRLGIDRRLDLFRRVCSAVTYAHQNLVIHRDLKPSNILVTAEGEPKLLDFGIAKLLSADDEPMLTQTAPGVRAMTPEYASPEQVKGERITTASDVYSLGVLLYQLLTGQKPYRLTTHTADELSRAVTSQQPERPSTALTRGDKSKIEVRNSKIVFGDLDNIVLMAMRKEPHRRYASVAALAEDIRRYRDGLPVLARKDTLLYRSDKFIRRHKLGVAAAAVVMLSLVAGIAIAVTQARRATAQARIAEEQRDAAQRATARAEKTSRFMQSFLANANPHWYARGQGRTDVTVREAMEDAAARIDTELADQPEVRGDLHHTIGENYRVAGEYSRAHEHFSRSFEAYREAYGGKHPKIAMALYYLSIVPAGADSSSEVNELMLRDGIAMMRETDPDNVNLPYMLQTRASQIMADETRKSDESSLAEAERLISEAKTLFLQHYGENHVATITADGSLAQLAQTRGDFALAERLAEEVLRRSQEIDDQGYNYIGGLFLLGTIKLAAGKTVEAETLFAQALELGRTQWGADDWRFTDLTRDIDQARSTRADKKPPDAALR